MPTLFQFPSGGALTIADSDVFYFGQNGTEYQLPFSSTNTTKPDSFTDYPDKLIGDQILLNYDEIWYYSFIIILFY